MRPKFLVLLIFIISAFDNCFSQTLYPPKAESPNSSGFSKSGEIPVNLFTGNPEISIPLHTLSYGSINVPITLRYSTALVKPAQQPGWVGSGWNLECFGSISRQTRGVVDEYYVNDVVSGNYRAYYPYPASSSQATANNFGSYLANIYPWYMPSQLLYDFFPSDCLGIDVQADEFSFNVLGHSGKFFYGGTSKGWQVVSDENVKVEVNDFYSPNDIGNAIRQYSLLVGMSSWIPMSSQSRMFGTFTLTVADGTKFIFGGRDENNIPDAVEFSMPVGIVSQEYYANPLFTANTWMLKKVIDVFGNEVDFSYIRKYPTVNKFYTASNFSYTAYTGSCTATESGGQSFDKNKLTGVFQWPVYISNISSPNENINFSMSEMTYNRYTDAQLTYADLSNLSSACDNSILGFDGYGDRLGKLQWEKLDKVIITDNMHHLSGENNYNPNIIKQYQFNYLNTQARLNQRLMLGALECQNKNGTKVNEYKFDYNSDFSAAVSPSFIYSDGNYTDHWGYFNGINLPNTGISFEYSKVPYPNTVTIELLNSITYPTGGKTQFIWESNDYSKIVAKNRQSFNLSNGYGGGPRISQIKNLLPNGSSASSKKYYYKTGYSAGVNVTTLQSSGVLNGTPSYTHSFNIRTGAFGQVSYGGSATAMSGIGNYSYTGQGSPVGYNEVVEVNDDGSYTKYFFTSYGTDINGISHWDKMPPGYLGFAPDEDTYFQRSSLENERGKPCGVFEYSASNVLLQKTINTYRNDAQRFTINQINTIENTSSYRSYALLYQHLNGGTGWPSSSIMSCSNDELVFATARFVYSYMYYPVSKTVIKYDEQGNNPQVNVTAFSYNANNLVKTKTETNSKNESVVTTYYYPNDFSDVVSQSMLNAHILTPILKETITKDNLPIRSVTTKYFQPYPTIFVPQNFEIQIGTNQSEIREQIKKYDTRGHILEVQKTNNVSEVYIWGYNSQYIVAKIVGSDYNTAATLINQTKLDQAGNGYNYYTDEDIRLELNKLRTGLPNAFVTTYTYKCGVGLATETDPNGNSTFYSYDEFARLSAIFDKNYNVLKKFCYNYSGLPEDCNTPAYLNDEQKATYTKTPGCPVGSITPNYIYTIPANSYTSFISKQEANRLALNAINSAASISQATANALPCLAAFSGLNKISPPWNVSLVNSSATFNKTYSLYQSTVATFFENIPTGQYNLSITPMYGGMVTTPMQMILNGITYTGTSFNVPNLNINAATSFIIQDPAISGSCSIAMSSGFTSQTSGISNNGSNVTFYMVFTPSASMQPNNTYTVATINGVCRPTTTQTLNYVSGGRSWIITIEPNGVMKWKLSSSSPALPANTTINTGNLIYNLN